MERIYLKNGDEITEEFVKLEWTNFGKPYLIWVNSRCLLTVFLGIEIQRDYVHDHKGFRIPYAQHSIAKFNCIGEATVQESGEIYVVNEINDHYSITLSDITQISPVKRSELP